MGMYDELLQKELPEPGLLVRLEDKRPSILPIIILGTLLVLSILFPIGLLLLMIQTAEGGFKLRFLFSCVLAALPSIYFARLFLWNRYGAEVLKVTENGVRLWNDYRFFTTNRRYLEGQTIHYAFIDEQINNNQIDDQYILDAVKPEGDQTTRLLLFNDNKVKCITNYCTSVGNWQVILQEAYDPEGKMVKLKPAYVEDSIAFSE